MPAGDDDRGSAVLRRRRVLDACTDDALDRRALVEQTDLSRTTIYRATVDLEERGWLVQADGGYRTTDRGVALVEAAESFFDAVDAIERLEPLFELSNHPELTTNAHLLGDATVVVADSSNPYRVVDRVTECFEETTRSRGTIAHPTASEAMGRVSNSLQEKDHIERIFSTSALEVHETVGGDEFRDVIAADSLSVYVADDEAVPFSFAIDDEVVTIVGHDPATGLPTVHVESDQAAARTWLERVYEQCRRVATPL